MPPFNETESLLSPVLVQVSLYAYFRKPDGSPLIERNANGRFRGNQPMSEHLFDERIIRKVVRSNWAVREGRIKKVGSDRLSSDFAKHRKHLARNEFLSPFTSQEVYMIVTPRVVVSAFERSLKDFGEILERSLICFNQKLIIGRSLKEPLIALWISQN